MPSTKKQYHKHPYLEAGFDRFWAAYPKRVAKLEAQKAWEHLKPSDDTIDAIVTALDWQRRSVAWCEDGGKFVPYPATYLRARRWLDEHANGHGQSTASDWRAECQIQHGGTCLKRWDHEVKMQARNDA